MEAEADLARLARVAWRAIYDVYNTDGDFWLRFAGMIDPPVDLRNFVYSTLEEVLDGA